MAEFYTKVHREILSPGIPDRSSWQGCAICGAPTRTRALIDSQAPYPSPAEVLQSVELCEQILRHAG